MSEQQRWGRWVLEENFLVFHPDPDRPDPGYEVNLSHIEDPATFSERLEDLQIKNWIVPGDLADLERARDMVLKARFVDEELLPAPRPLSWEEHPRAVKRAWMELLSTADPMDESLFQEFLEQNPCLLPGPHGTTHGHYHGPVNQSVYTQPELPGFRAKRPDFLLLEQDSATIYAILIEIEAPGKRWSTSAGAPTAQLTRAIDQLRDWKSWFSEPLNEMTFRRLYGIHPDQTGFQRFVQHYVLVYGRRDDATRIEAFAKKRHDLQGNSEFFMTYDRLEPTRPVDFTLRQDRSGPDNQLRLVAISPEFRLNSDTAIWFSMLIGREHAILRNSLITPERKQFLLERIPIADRYAAEVKANRATWYTRDGFVYET